MLNTVLEANVIKIIKYINIFIKQKTPVFAHTYNSNNSTKNNIKRFQIVIFNNKKSLIKIVKKNLI